MVRWQGGLTAAAYHTHGMTPLMAVQRAQHEGAAALIAAGARLDMTNCRGWKGQSIPQWLQQGLQGNLAECRRVSQLASPLVEIIL